MAFYVKPPHGSLHLAGLEAMAWRRLRFLMEVSKASHSAVAMKDLIQLTGSSTDSDCLIEGSQKDAVSHFILRLACCQDGEMERFFTQAETQLFTYRFSCMTAEELYACVRPLRQFIRLASRGHALSTPYRDIIAIVNGLTQHYNWKTLIANFVSLETDGFLSLPFVYVVELVRRRAVVLHHGIARVPCSKLCDVMTTVFRLLLQWGMVLAKRVLPPLLETDTRIAKLLRTMKVYFHRRYSPFRSLCDGVLEPLRCEEVDGVVEMFPPCMSHLHAQLRRKHRLSHASRIEYTLFLKELGLPVHEALQFWRAEYSQDPSQKASHNQGCQHTWQRDGKRYTYSIRHLYGLEGARINYRGHCCSSLQNRVMSGMGDGGCPFKHFDKQHLIRKLSLAELPLDSVRFILKLATQEGCYNQACQIYLGEKLEHLRSLRKSNGHVALGKPVVQIADFRSRSETESIQNMPVLGMDKPNDIATDGCQKHHVTSKFESLNKVGQSSSKYILPRHTANATSSSQFEPRAKLCERMEIPCGRFVGDLSLTQRVQEKPMINKQVIDGCPCCFEHQQCASSQYGVNNEPQKTISAAGDVTIDKPFDFFIAYKSLLYGMK